MLSSLWHHHTWRWWRLIIALIVALLLLLLSASAAHARPATLPAALPATVYTQSPCVALRATPSATATLLALAIPGVGLRVTGLSGDGQWYHALFLGALPVWVLASDVATSYQTHFGLEPDCPFNGLPPIVAHPLSHVSGPFALQAAGTVTQFSALRAAPAATARATATLLPGERAYITQWAADANGDVWYLAHAGGTLGWVWAYAVLFDGPDPATAAVNGVPVWTAASGKGLWFTDYLTHHTDLRALVAAAKALGVTHIYPRVAETSYGFYDHYTLDHLLPLAHAAGIKVIAWVYPYLRDVGTDLIMTQQVVNYRAPGGDHVDGIIADIETRTDAPAVFAYGQVLRQMVGPDTPLIISTFSPHARPSYPFPEAAASFNVISPQDYWHSVQGSMDAAAPRALLTLSIMSIRAELGGKAFPIEEDGQMYDQFTYGEPGGNQPSPAEITSDMQAAKDLGCVGISFFDWRTASPDELAAFQAFQW
jgi:hypothetical protein